MTTQFQEKVYKIVKKVPRGKVTTYKDISKILRKKSYRAVGNALNKNPIPGTHESQVPCHRVVKSNGEAGGFAHGTKKKVQMLKKEGIEITNNRIDLKKYKFKLNK